MCMYMDALLVPTDNNELLGSDILPNKRRRKKSIVWEHFVVKKVDAEHIRAYCKQCEKSFAYITGSKLAGTSHLKRHIALGICPVTRQKNQLMTGTPGPRSNHILLNGQLLVGNCFARVLSNIAQDALGIMREVICKIRENVKYVKTSETHEDKFLELKQQLQVPSMKDLVIDDQTKWNSTYHMLVAACELQEVFACLDTSDPDYKITPSIDEWRQFFDACNREIVLFLDSLNFGTSCPG
ncbi:hypothetical protein F8388_026994 [Cannabis sativa]|uniref:BED-type domain-containing protein n=1 Tax=Cannabis sativa TaxID=3483 RepID=A0A7J6FNM9_CANSA|nr:hypothetical protein F8388_026994 [Cannabis sativa]